MWSTSVQTDDSIAVFARKLLKPFAFLSEDEILNEFRAIQKLCIESSHENLVAVYRCGRLPGSLYYYIDMEFCDLNLQEYIYDFEHRGSAASKGLAPLDTKAVLQIMRDVSRGLTFIHERKEVHRDIKPHNSNPVALPYLMNSIVFFQRRGLEDWGFWLRHREGVWGSLEDRNEKRDRKLSSSRALEFDRNVRREC